VRGRKVTVEEEEEFGFADTDVWHATIDGHMFAARVVRVPGNEDLGVLTAWVAATGAVLLTRRVPFAYGALFGPDVDDVVEWQSWVLEAIDNKATENGNGEPTSNEVRHDGGSAGGADEVASGEPWQDGSCTAGDWTADRGWG
jgi:hypothetical protein